MSLEMTYSIWEDVHRLYANTIPTSIRDVSTLGSWYLPKILGATVDNTCSLEFVEEDHVSSPLEASLLCYKILCSQTVQVTI